MFNPQFRVEKNLAHVLTYTLMTSLSSTWVHLLSVGTGLGKVDTGLGRLSTGFGKFGTVLGKGTGLGKLSSIVWSGIFGFEYNALR